MSKITKSAEGQPCMFNVFSVCAYDSRKTMFCHCPSEYSGIGLKSVIRAENGTEMDWGAVGCKPCHDFMDAVRKPDDTRMFYWMRALPRMMELLLNERIINVGK